MLDLSVKSMYCRNYERSGENMGDYTTVVDSTTVSLFTTLDFDHYIYVFLRSMELQNM